MNIELPKNRALDICGVDTRRMTSLMRCVHADAVAVSFLNAEYRVFHSTLTTRCSILQHHDTRLAQTPYNLRSSNSCIRNLHHRRRNRSCSIVTRTNTTRSSTTGSHPNGLQPL